MEKIMNRARLVHLIDVLEAVEKSDLPFDMKHWAIVKQDKSICGTVACAAGHAALDPEFRADGFVLESGSGEKFDSFDALDQYMPFREQERPYVSFGSYSGWDAIGEFFGLTYKQTYYIFGEKSYLHSDIAPEDVIEHVRHALDGTMPPSRV